MVRRVFRETIIILALAVATMLFILAMLNALTPANVP